MDFFSREHGLLVDFDAAARKRIDLSMDMLGSTLQASETRRILEAIEQSERRTD
jgi:hypothetical protein